MITQHVVSFGDDITLTRLPAGRAAGFVWLSFVVQGIESLDHWRIRDHIRLTWLDGATADVVDRGATGDGSLHLFDVSIRDAGYNTLTIRYVEGNTTLSLENVPLPGS